MRQGFKHMVEGWRYSPSIHSPHFCHERQMEKTHECPTADYQRQISKVGNITIKSRPNPTMDHHFARITLLGRISNGDQIKKENFCSYKACLDLDTEYPQQHLYNTENAQN